MARILALLLLACVGFAESRLGLGSMPTLTGTTLTASGGMSVAPDTDAISYFGRVAMGYDGANADIAYWAHYDNLSSVNAALLQTSAGQTVLNAKAGQSIGFRINNSTRMSLTSTALTLSTGFTTSYTDTTDATANNNGAVTVAGGLSAQKYITVGGASGNTIRYTAGVANAAVATTLGSVGPTGSTAGNPQGWIRISINGTDRYIPYW